MTDPDFELHAWLVTYPVEQIDHKATGGFLRQYRESTGLSLKDLGERLNLSASYLCDLERGKRNWSKKLVKRYVEAMGE